MSKTFRVNNHIKIALALSAKQTIVPIVAKLRKPCQNFLVCILGLPNFICVQLRLRCLRPGACASYKPSCRLGACATLNQSGVVQALSLAVFGIAIACGIVRACARACAIGCRSGVFCSETCIFFSFTRTALNEICLIQTCLSLTSRSLGRSFGELYS